MSKAAELLTALTSGEGIEDFEPDSRMEAYLKNCYLACGCDGLPEPITDADELLYALAEKMAGGGSSGGSGGGGEATELLFETTFSVAESIFTTTKTTLATIQTGLTQADCKVGDLYFVVIKCTNDTESDFSKSHFMERFQTVMNADGGYPGTSLQSGVIYFYRADKESLYAYGGANGGVLVSSCGQWMKSLTVQAVGSGNGGGYAVSGDYNLKLYKVNMDFFGLEGLNNA